MELIIVLKPTAMIWDSRGWSHWGTSLKEFSGSKPGPPGQIKGSPTSPNVPLKRQVLLKNREGGVFNRATVGRGPAAPTSALRWV